MTAKRLTTYALDGKFIKHWLIDNDTTQAELAEAVGVSPVLLSRYINDNRSVPLRILFSLAEEMRADLRDLVVKVEER